MDGSAMRHGLPLACILLLVGVTTLPLPAFAQAEDGQQTDQRKQNRSDLSDEEKRKLKKRIQAAREAYQNEEYEQSVEKLERAYKLYPNPAFFYRIGLAHQNAGNYRAAIDSFERYLEEKPETSKRDEIEDRLAELEQRASDSEEDAPETDAPHDEESGTADRGEDDNGGSEEASIDPEKLEESDSGNNRTLGYVFGGAGLAGVLSSGAFTYLYFQSRNELEDLRSSNRRTSETEARESSILQQRNRRLAIAYASGGVAVVGLGAAAYFLLQPSDAAGDQSTRLLNPDLLDTDGPRIGLSTGGDGSEFRLHFGTRF